jgi:hypothetical protein
MGRGIEAESPVRRPQNGRRMRPKYDQHSYASVLIAEKFLLT